MINRAITDIYRKLFMGFGVRGAQAIVVGAPQHRQQHTPLNTYGAYALPITIPNTAASTKVLGVSFATERTIATETAGQIEYRNTDGSNQSLWTAAMFQAYTLGDTTFVAATADLTTYKGTQDNELYIKWPNPHNYNAWAVQVAFESAQDPTLGIPIRRSTGSGLAPAYLHVSNGGGR